jgi:hypothetical protein
MSEADLSATDYKIRFGTLNAFFWTWVKRNNFTKRKLVVMLALAAAFAVVAAMPVAPMIMTTLREGTVPILLAAFFGIFAILYFVFMSSFILYVLSPTLSYVVQLFGFVFGPMRRRVNSIRIDAGGFHKTSNGEPNALDWSQVHEVVATKSSILIFTNRNCAVMIPKSAFASRDAADAFAQAAVTYWMDAKSVF